MKKHGIEYVALSKHSANFFIIISIKYNVIHCAWQLVYIY